MLAITTFVAPVISAALCRFLGAHWGEALGEEVSVTQNDERSGPGPGDANPFASGDADVGWVCAPSYLALHDESPPGVRLLGIGAVHDDPRCGGLPVYHSELVVHADAPHARFDDLRDAHFVYNDDSSLSGKLAMLDRLIQRGHDADFLASITPSGSHLSSMRLVAEAQADCATIDVNVYRVAPEALRRRLRVLETIGPYPVQPAIVRASMPEARAALLRDVALRLHEQHAATLAQHGIVRFAAVAHDDYAVWRARIVAANALL